MSKRYWASRDLESTALLVWFDRKPRMDSAGNFWVGSLFNRGHAFITENTINLNSGECVEIEPIKLVRKAASTEYGECDCGKIEHGRHHMACPALKPKKQPKKRSVRRGKA